MNEDSVLIDNAIHTVSGIETKIIHGNDCYVEVIPRYEAGNVIIGYDVKVFKGNDN